MIFKDEETPEIDESDIDTQGNDTTEEPSDFDDTIGDSTDEMDKD